MIKKLDHLVITTQSLQPCLDFYRKLGFEPRSGGGRYALFAGDFKINVHIRGQELLPHAHTVCPGSADLCFELTGSLEEYQNVLEAQNIALELGPVERTGAHGAMRSLYLRDPDGNLLEFCSYL